MVFFKTKLPLNILINKKKKKKKPFGLFGVMSNRHESENEKKGQANWGIDVC